MSQETILVRPWISEVFLGLASEVALGGAANEEEGVRRPSGPFSRSDLTPLTSQNHWTHCTPQCNNTFQTNDGVLPSKYPAMNLPDFLTTESTGEIRVAGRRIGLYHVVHYSNEGWTSISTETDSLTRLTASSAVMLIALSSKVRRVLCRHLTLLHVEASRLGHKRATGIPIKCGWRLRWRGTFSEAERRHVRKPP